MTGEAFDRAKADAAAKQFGLENGEYFNFSGDQPKPTFETYVSIIGESPVTIDAYLARLWSLVSIAARLDQNPNLYAALAETIRASQIKTDDLE